MQPGFLKRSSRLMFSMSFFFLIKKKKAADLKATSPEIVLFSLPLPRPPKRGKGRNKRLEEQPWERGVKKKKSQFEKQHIWFVKCLTSENGVFDGGGGESGK